MKLASMVNTTITMLLLAVPPLLPYGAPWMMIPRPGIRLTNASAGGRIATKLQHENHHGHYIPRLEKEDNSLQDSDMVLNISIFLR